MNQISIETAIERLILYARQKLLLKRENVTVVRNRLLFELKVNAPEKPADTCGNLDKDILEPIMAYALKNKFYEPHEAMLYETRIIGIVMPLPSEVTAHFDMLVAKKDMPTALKWFHQFCIDCKYIRKKDIERNIVWSTVKSHGEIGITINLSKPEKDPKEIAAALAAPKTDYPACMLCIDNVGFYGNALRPARNTLRTIPIILNDEAWEMQYSPYAYFDQHCIALCDDHRNMNVNSATFVRLFDFVQDFSDYFLGSNAALPIVGGSILSHDHYQGGLKVLPLFKSKPKFRFVYDKYPQVEISILDWYNSAIRISGTNRDDVLSTVNYIHDNWLNYSDESVNIIAKTDAQHNAITPIARLENKTYVMDIILRNNRTDAKHPYGIFHPTEDLHNIKKEGIGLIEAMGLFILPGRLSKEASLIKDILTGTTPIDFKKLSDDSNPLAKHRSMIAQLVTDHGTKFSDSEAGKLITEYINDACEKILGCTAVFKTTPEGETAFLRFMQNIGLSNIDQKIKPLSTPIEVATSNASNLSNDEVKTEEVKRRGRPKKTDK